MRFSEVWKTSFKAIGKNKRRSFLTMIGLIIGVSAVITVFSIGRAFENYASEFIGLDQFDGSVGYTFSAKDETFHENGLSGFTEEDISQIESIPGVQSVNYYDNSRNGVKYADQTFDDVGNDGRWNCFKLIKNKGSKVLYGRGIQASDYYNENPVVVIDQTAAKAIQKEEPASLVGQSVKIGGHLFEVVGIMEDRNGGTIVSTQEDYVVAELPENVFESYFNSEDHSMIQVKMNQSANIKDVSKEAENTLKKYGTWKELGNYKTEDLAGQVDQLRMLLTSITLLISVIGGISLFISGIGVMNMIYISVSERTKEIGVRRAMGGTKGNIMMQFLLEGISLTLVGGTIGYLIAMLLGFAISLFTPLSVRPDLFTVTLAFGLSVVIGIVFSWLPAKSAAKKDIVSLLR
ncbi:MAG: ABC transporter permease [Enterococcus sp.]|uniref:ABC transporter permease n=1 Tax=Enterococcus sp. TaxID=35783 RepID=UPI002647425E|nr:ABC transporter permease [Enterococcus sp.]MDN6003899.1 ABC transporter permease [Enterococcus sp.]MDN6217860.1 ABC transporter permease [Enterococcus sp.]MDN6517339.1 ABC transporter permease [Enterococcus sp.]MDN6560202.1 ABC transporter permease [Enterococcus sp.]MDN6584703.1 ABC transporter permease [Enterococcus sp.]